MTKTNIFILVFALINVLNSISISVFSQARDNIFKQQDLTTVGVYYYPEHWDSLQWERDFQNMSKLGFEFTHFAEFAWVFLEPEEGKYQFHWLDRSIELAAKYNLKVILCTSTATPPVWLVRKHPEVLLTEQDGEKLDHGARQHATFSSNYYRMYSLKMIEELAKRYGQDKRVIGWQLDNEPMAFNDFGEDAYIRFRQWLKRKYVSINNLNKAWGTAFWGQVYSDFGQINIPRRNQDYMNPHQRLDHSRFVASETSSFLDEQALVIKKYRNSSQWITTNYIPNYSDGFIGTSKELDFLTYTKYMVVGFSKGIGKEGYRLGDAESIAMSNDFFRPLSKYYGVMELQPGQVNWGTINSQPAPGAVRLWLWHVFSGGSDLICTYRYRAPIYGVEHYHYGIVGTDGVTPTPGGLEYQKFINEVKILRKQYKPKPVPESYRVRKTGILFNHENLWDIDQNPLTTLWNTLDHIQKYYKALKACGSPVDFINDTSDFKKYPFLVVPAYQNIDSLLIRKLYNYAYNGGNLIISCRTGHKNRDGQLWEARFGEPIYKLIGAEIEFFDLLMPHDTGFINFENQKYPWQSWAEILKPFPTTEIWATYQNSFYSGKPSVIYRKLNKGSVVYVGADSWNGSLEKEVILKVYQNQNISVKKYPEGVMVEYRDGYGIAVNYSDKPYQLDLNSTDVVIIGKATLESASVTVWKY